MIKLIGIFPGLAWYQDYTRKFFKRDLLSGITIAAMLIPQGMGYALVAGLPAEYGLYACIIPPIIYALLGTSNKLSIGPVALDSILILSGLSLIAEPGSDNYLVLAVTLTLMVGVIQFSLGLFKFGFIANFLSYPVILGYTSAASIIIIGSQFENVLGVDVGVGNVFGLVSKYAQNISMWHWPTLAISMIGLLVLIYPKRWLPNLPFGLILIVSGMVVSSLLNVKGYGVSVIDYIPQGLPVVIAPSYSWEIVKQLIPTALTVSLMGYVGSMSICKAQERPSDKFQVRPNQELIAVGAANLAGSFFKAFPVSASFSRSASFVEAGAMTQASAVVSSITIVVILIFFTPAFAHYPLPKALLAVIIMTSVWGLFKPKDIKALYYQNRHEFIIAMLTFITTLLLGVQQGLLVGVVLSIGRVLYNTAAPHMTELGAMQDGKLYRNVNRFKEVKYGEMS
jgi:SulP family sulfate permease